MSLRSLLTDLKDSAKKTFSGVDTAGSLSNKFWQSKAADNLSSWQKLFDEDKGKEFVSSFKRTPTNNRQRLGNSLIDIAGNMTAMGTEGGYQLKKGFQTKDKNLIGKGLIKSGTALLTARGVGMPLQAATYSALPGAISGVGNYIKTKDTKQALNAGIGGAIDFLPKAVPMTAIGSITNPLINKIGVGKNFAQRNALKAVPNVIEGIAMDKATGMETTPQSMLIDAVAPAFFDLAGMTFKSANDARIKAKYKIDETLGTGARKNGKYASLDELLGKKKGKGKSQLMGVMAGVQPYQDKDGKWRVRFNKERALLGLGLAYGGTKILKGAGDTAKGSDLDDILKAQNLKNNADDLISEARKYKSAEEFVKAQGEPLYHGTTYDWKGDFKDKTTYLTPKKEFAESIADEQVDNIINKLETETAPNGKSYYPTIKTLFKKANTKLFDANNPSDIKWLENNLPDTVKTTSYYGGTFDTPKADVIKNIKGKGEHTWVEFEGDVGDIIKKGGYDGLIATEKGYPSVAIFNPNKSLISKQKFIEIYNQANKVGGVGVKDFRTGSVELNKPVLDIQKPLQGQTKGASLSSSLTQQKGIQIPQQQISPLQGSKQSFEDIITQNKNMIGSTVEKPKQSAGDTLKNLYTQWVDRYAPISRASDTAKAQLKTQGAELRPEYDPTVLVRRLTGAGGIADSRYQNELKPIISEMDNLKIDKGDMDLYLANKRIAGFGTANRQVYGADTKKAGEIVNAIETKYGGNIQGIAEKLYKYQDDGFNEMVNAGFISPETAKIIKGQNPDYAPLQRVMDNVDNYLGLPTRKTMQGTQPISKLKGSTKQIDSPLENIIGNTFKQRAAIEKNRVASSIVGLQKIAPQLGFSKVAKSGDDTITVWNGGKKEFWKVGNDIAETAKGLNEENINTILKIFKAPASLLRQGATGRNPEFLIPNVIRDQLDAGVTSKYGYIPLIDYFSGLKSMLTNDDIYKKWENSGAKIDLGEMSGRKSIKESFDSKVGKKNLFTWIGDVLDIMGKYSEQPTRVGLFKKAYNKTGNEMLAMMESRDATVDFARMGSKMKTANSIIPFLNVGVQGFDKLIRAVKDNPAKVALNGTIYGVLPAVATTIYNIINHGEEYSEIPQYEKDANFVIVKGRNENGTVDYITIPKGNIIPTIANPIENFLSYFSGTSPLEFKEYAMQLFTSTLPIIGDGSSLGEVALKTVGSNLPQLVKPITENLVNKSFYKYDPKKAEAKEIVPYYLKDEEPYKQDYEFTPQMYKKIGAVLNVSPLQVKNLMEGYLAGYAKIPAQIVEMMYKTSNKDAVSPNEKTILRRFIKQTYPSSSKAKPEEEKKKTPFMQRVVDDVDASTSTSTGSQLTEVRKAVRESGKEMKTSDLIVFPYDDSTKTVKKTISMPKLTSNNELNKKIISDYKSDLTDYEKYIMYQYESGAINEDKAGTELERIANIKKALTNATKTSKAKKVDLAKISQKILKPVKVSSKSPKFDSFKILSDYRSTKMPEIKAPDLKVIDFKTAKLKKGTK